MLENGLENRVQRTRFSKLVVQRDLTRNRRLEPHVVTSLIQERPALNHLMHERPESVVLGTALRHQVFDHLAIGELDIGPGGVNETFLRQVANQWVLVREQEPFVRSGRPMQTPAERRNVRRFSGERGTWGAPGLIPAARQSDLAVWVECRGWVTIRPCQVKMTPNFFDQGL